MKYLTQLLILLGFFWVALGAQDSSQQEQKSQSASEKEAKPVVQKEEASPPSLFELARQSREKRSRSGEVRVIRNEDLQSLKGARVSVGKGSPRAGRSAGGDEEEVDVEVDGSGDEEAGETGDFDLDFWRQAFQEARSRLETAVNRVMVLELRMNNAQNAYLQESDGSTREYLQSQLAETYEELVQAREDEKTARTQVEELQRQALKAGLTPGQVRKFTGDLPESSSVTEGLPQGMDSNPSP